MSRWNTEKNFASWLGLCPDNRVSGGKVLKRGTRQVVNRAATALRLAAWSLIRSQSALGANFRRLRSKLGAPKAVTAMAHQASCGTKFPTHSSFEYYGLGFWRLFVSAQGTTANALQCFNRTGLLKFYKRAA